MGEKRYFGQALCITRLTMTGTSWKTLQCISKYEQCINTVNNIMLIYYEFICHNKAKHHVYNHRPKRILTFKTDRLCQEGKGFIWFSLRIPSMVCLIVSLSFF